MAKKKYYAVKIGKIPGIYETWDQCKEQVYHFPGAVYKSFSTKEEARDYMSPTKGEQMEIDEDTIIAYVDGSYDDTTKRFSYGMIILGDEEIYMAEALDDEELATMRNVAGEIRGSMEAMKYAIEHGYKKLAIYFDYEGIEKWATGQWKTNKEGTRDYKAFCEKAMKEILVKFMKVKGHSGDEYNDVADMLAKSALGIGDGTFEPLLGNQWGRVK